MARNGFFPLLTALLTLTVSCLAAFSDDGDFRLQRTQMPPVAPVVQSGASQFQDLPQSQLQTPAPAGYLGHQDWVNAFSMPVVPRQSAAIANPDQFTVRLKHQAPAMTPAVDAQRLDGGVTALDLKILGEHDVAIVVDKSGSMSTSDCPAFNPGAHLWQRALIGFVAPGMMPMGGGMLTRWQFVQQQTLALARQTQQVLPAGITLVLFSGHYTVFPHVDLRQIPYIFSMNRPGGTTDTTGALRSQLDDYFMRRDASGGRVHPLAIAVITDGMPNNPRSLRDLIVDATRRMRKPGEISITFLQIGTERKGYELLRDLDDNLVRQGARYDIVDSKPFPEVVHVGLARALVDSITEGQRN